MLRVITKWAQQLMGAGCAVALLSVSPAVTAQKLPAAEFFKPAQISNVAMSPDGKSILGIRTVNGRHNITVVDLSTKKALIITNFKEADVVGARWISENRIGFSLIDRTRGMGDQLGQGFFAIDKDASNYRSLVERSFASELGGSQMPAGSSMISRVYVDGKPSDEVLMAVPSLQARGKVSTTIYRLNTRTGRSTLASMGAPDNTLGWVATPSGELRVAMTNVGDDFKLYFRDNAETPWRVIAEFVGDDVEKTINPVALTEDGTLLVSAYNGNNETAIYKYDTKNKQITGAPLFAVAGHDLQDGLIQRGATGEVIGFNYETDRPKTAWVNAKAESLQKGIDGALPDTVNRLSGPLDQADSMVLITSFSDRASPRYYLYDQKSKQLEQIASSRPWLDPKKMGKTEFIRYNARDGLSIPGMLTMPPDSEGKKPPLVVLHYGGPWVRAIHYGFDANVQFLASRGYAVFMPAPRGSTEWGLKHFKSGWKQWGLAMQDDVTDGVKTLIEQGRVDGKRVCITGASYGGYLTMMGLVKEPELFKCGVNWVGVTDPSFMFTVTWTDFNQVDNARFSLARLIGDVDKDRQQFEQTSPLKRAAEIKQPVLMAYGGLDVRVPIINGEKMYDALKGHNKNVEWVRYNDEGHGWLKQENIVDFWERFEKFLGKNL